MMSDDYLTEVFCRELEQTQNLPSAVRAVRMALEAEREMRLARRGHGEAGSRGPAPQVPLSEGEIATVLALVASDLKMPLELLKEGTARPYLHGRWVAAGVLRAFRLSLNQIATALAMTDHTRALDALRRLQGFPDLLASKGRVLDRLCAQGWTVKLAGSSEPAKWAGGREAA